jgi:hypothetical protein
MDGRVQPHPTGAAQNVEIRERGGRALKEAEKEAEEER